MLKKLQLPDAVIALKATVLVVLIVYNSFSINAIVTDREQFETPVQKIRLLDHPYFKIYHGGVLQQIPLKQIQLIKIDPSSSLIFENELYYSAELIFKSGAKIQSMKDKTKRNPVFISIQNTLVGKSKFQIFSINLANVIQIQIKK